MSEAAQTTADGGTETEMVVGETVDGTAYSLPVEDILTGRGFVTGKSGAGKSNTGSVVAEELLERGHPLLIVDVDGEYWGLKEDFEILHVGATEECDLQVGPEHAPKLAELALEQHVPIVLDVSGYLDGDVVDELVLEVAQELFAREQEALQPFLMLVEEIHEFLPQQGGLGDVGEMLVRVAKRGRKRGLGIIGASQRPANVQKDFITQADLLVWHRLTWDNDVDVVRRVVGGDVAEEVPGLADGEAFVQADWSEADVERVQFRRKHTFDAGATPGLDDVERPELQSVDADLVGELEEISERQQHRQDRIEQLERELEAKDEEITDLEDELDRLKTADETLDLLTARLQGTDAEAAAETPDEVQERLESKNEEIRDLEGELADVREERDDLADCVDELEAEVQRLRGIEERVEQAERIEEQLDRAREVLAVDVEAAGPADDALRAELQESKQRIEELEEQLKSARRGNDTRKPDLAQKLEHEAIQSAVDIAKESAATADEHFDRALAAFAASGGGPLTAGDVAPMLDTESKSPAQKALRALFEAGVLQREKTGSGYEYEIDEEFANRRIQVAQQQ